MLDPHPADAPAPAPAPRALDPDGLNRRLFSWHAVARRNLVVRGATTPWAVLVGEVMSQQTQIDRIGPAWERWMARWPAPADLAAASSRDVITAWAGLGYNRRALALHEAARAIVREHDGRVPSTIEALEALPGIGPYTARAIAASAFGLPVAPLDVNVRRVVGRLLGEGAGGPGSMPARALQPAADTLVARQDPRRWVDSVMDLAATVCTARDPGCDVCPLRDLCPSAGKAGSMVAARPTPRPPVRFEATNRWLRGCLLRAAREATGEGWISIPPSLGEHSAHAVEAALGALTTEGFVELDADRYRLRAG